MINMEELNLDGFQIVKSEMFLHLPRKADPTCTIWPTKISFSRMTLQALNNCEYVRLEVNPSTKCLLLAPTHSSDKDSIRWIKGQKEFSVRNMESRQFGEEVYKAWGLDEQYNYRAVGRLVSARNKIMMLFDFSTAEMWKTKKVGNQGE